LLNKPLDFVKYIKKGKHVVVFYEEVEYQRTIAFKYIENGLLNKEQCYFITTIEDDIEFVKRDLQDSIDVDNDNYDDKVTKDIDNFIKNNLLYISILPDFFDYPYGIENTVKDIVKIVKPTNNQSYLTSHQINTPLITTKKIVLFCMHKIETMKQIQTNVEWEKKYRNDLLRSFLPECSIICTYYVKDILAAIKGDSSLYSEWMANLLELYDAVIYARGYWNGSAFNLR
jgi:hypothetical protein